MKRKSTGPKEELLDLIHMGAGYRSIYYKGHGEFVVAPQGGPRDEYYDMMGHQLMGVYDQSITEAELNEDAEWVLTNV